MLPRVVRCPSLCVLVQATRAPPVPGVLSDVRSIPAARDVSQRIDGGLSRPRVSADTLKLACPFAV